MWHCNDNKYVMYNKILLAVYNYTLWRMEFTDIISNLSFISVKIFTVTTQIMIFPSKLAYTSMQVFAEFCYSKNKEILK